MVKKNKYVIWNVLQNNSEGRYRLTEIGIEYILLK